MSVVLSPHSIRSMKNVQHGIMENYVIQVLEAKKVKDNYLKFQIFDGQERFKAMHQVKKKDQSDSDLQDFSIIRVTQHLTHQNNGEVMAIEILDFKLITNLKEIYAAKSYNKNPFIKQQHADEKKVQFENNFVQTTSKKLKSPEPGLQNSGRQSIAQSPIQTFQPISNNKKMMSIDYESEPEEVCESDIKRFENLLDLYVDMPGWEVLVRVLSKDYREFMSKNNKLTKIFKMEVMDRLGWIAEATMFGDDAKSYYQSIKLNCCYRISRAQVREENYNSKRGGKYSKTTIGLSKNTCIVPVKNVELIPNSENAPSLGEMLKIYELDTVYDMVAILTMIGEEREIEKEGKTIIKQTIFVSDPEVMKTVEVIIWNRTIKVDESMLNKTIFLKQFKINLYRDVLNLNSFFKSEINLKINHRFNSMEKSFKSDQCEQISNNNPKKDDKSVNDKDSKVKRNLKELEDQCYHLEPGETLISELDLWLNHMSFRGKWFYEGCPKCKKAATAFEVCHNCSNKIDQTVTKYILPIQMSDVCGSLWTTAFDDTASMIFNGQGAKDLKQLDESELKDQAEKRLYHEYKIKVMTKKEESGLKHSIIGKVTEINLAKKARSNVERIKRSI